MSGRRRDPPDTSQYYSIKVDNITYRTNVDDLRRVFSKYGSIGDIYIPRDPRTFESRGYAFVRFSHERDADYAIRQMDGVMLNGRQIRCHFARYAPTGNRTRRRSGSRSGSRDRGRRRSSRSGSRSDSRSRSRSRSRRRDSPKRRSPKRKEDKPRSRSPSVSPKRDSRSPKDRSRSPKRADSSRSRSRSGSHRSGEEVKNGATGVNAARLSRSRSLSKDGDN